MKTFIEGVGRLGGTLLLTLLSMAMSVGIIAVILVILGVPFDEVNVPIFLFAVIVPAIIAPIICWCMLGLLLKIYTIEEQQRRFATFDQLTELMTRRSFFQVGERLLNRCVRNKQDFTLVMIDIDNFKAINDTYGHAGGDEVLKSLASILQETFRANDVIGRIGGEEFAISLAQSNVDFAMISLERLRLIVSDDRVEYLGNTIQYTISVGASGYQGGSDVEALDELMRYADDALYQAKTRGKNCVIKSTSVPA